MKTRGSLRFPLICEAILRAVSYADVFAFPLSDYEIYLRLITPFRFTQSEVKRALRAMPQLQEVGGYWGLRSIGKLHASRVKRRMAARKTLEDKMRLARQAARFLSRFPTVSCICLTGGIAVGNARKSDDIDLMIITRPGRLWLTRALIVFVSRLMRMYRTRALRNTANKWCLNLWMDERSLQLPLEAQNLYTAHEVLQAQCLFDRSGAYQQFLDANRWVSAYLPNLFDERMQHAPKYHSKTRMNVNLPGLRAALFRPLEDIAYLLQERRMRRVISRERVSPVAAFFHPRNTQGRALQRHAERLRRLHLPPYPFYTSSELPSSVYQTPPVFQKILQTWQAREQGKTTVFATGIFDLLHREHRRYLQKAKKAGGFLVVGIESDYRVRRVKGNGRPVENQRVRLRKVSNLPSVDAAFIFPEDFFTPLRFEEPIFYFRPDLYACSSHSPHQKEKQRLMRKYRGKVVIVHEYNPKISTSLLLEQQHAASGKTARVRVQ